MFLTLQILLFRTYTMNDWGLVVHEIPQEPPYIKSCGCFSCRDGNGPLLCLTNCTIDDRIAYIVYSQIKTGQGAFNIPDTFVVSAPSETSVSYSICCYWVIGIKHKIQSHLFSILLSCQARATFSNVLLEMDVNSTLPLLLSWFANS